MTQLGMVITTKPGFFSRKDIQPTGLPGYGCAYATYLLGTEAWAGTDFGPTEDASMNGRNLVVTGTVGTGWVAGPSNYATTPFNGDQLCSRTGKCTIIAVTRIAPGVSAWPISNHTNVTSSSYLGIFATNSSASYSARHYVNGQDRRSDDNGNASTRSGFEFIAGTFGVNEGTKLYRSATGDDLHVRPADLTPPIATLGGDLPFMMGRSHVLGTNGNCDVAFASFFDDVLTPAQIEEYLTYVTALLSTSQGVTVEGGSPDISTASGTPEQMQIAAMAYAAPLLQRLEVLTGRVELAVEDGAGGPLTPTSGPNADGWVKLPAIYKLLFGGSGTVTIDTRNRAMVVTPSVAVYDTTNTTEDYPFFDGAYQVRATLTGTATAEIV